jgi:hypothetical protein
MEDDEMQEAIDNKLNQKPRAKAIKVKVKAKRPIIDPRLKGLSKDQKLILKTLVAKGQLNTNDLVALRTGNAGSQSELASAEMTKEQLKIQRNTARKTGEKLAAKGLVIADKVPNITERTASNGQVQTGAFGFVMQYRLAPNVRKLIESIEA